MRRPIAFLLGLLLVAGCKPGDADGPFTDSRLPPSLGQRSFPPQGWAWGLIQTEGAPPMRYGVAGPAGTAPKGDVLILCGYGQSAEDWFATASALTAKGYIVWVLDGAGQGGSGRFAGPRDLGHVPDFAFEVAGLKAMAGVISRPVVVIGQTTAAPTVLTALGSGLQARAALLFDPVFDPAAGPIGAGAARAGAPAMVKARLGWLRATGQHAWKRPEPAPTGAAAWRQANPDLRMGGVSWGWIEAFERQAHALTPARLAQIPIPVQMGRFDGRPLGTRPRGICTALPHCVILPAPGSVESSTGETDAVTTTVDRTFAAP